MPSSRKRVAPSGAPSRNTLSEYERKRNFSKTREPSGKAKTKRKGKAKRSHPRFAIQKHSATSEHYDLRLEVDGVLASWAIPKGPSLDPADKRMAIYVEDHPIDYAPPRCLVWVATASRGADLVFLGSAESRFSAPA